MTKTLISFMISGIVLFALLTGGTVATFASIYLWVMGSLMVFMSLVLMFILLMANKVPWPADNPLPNQHRFMLTFPMRVVAFTVSMLTAFVAYTTGYENLAIFYGSVCLVGQFLVSCLLSMFKRMYNDG